MIQLLGGMCIISLRSISATAGPCDIHPVVSSTLFGCHMCVVILHSLTN